MRPIPWAALLISLGPPAVHAAESCPWMTTATAAGFLDGPVAVTVSRVDTPPPGTPTANAISSAGPTSANSSAEHYSGNGLDDADCLFEREPSRDSGELRIEVRTMADHAKQFASYLEKCRPQAVSLKAIGNEAVVCRLSKPGQVSEQVVGRVRERAFVIRLSMSASSISPSALREKMRMASEIGAGNLF